MCLVYFFRTKSASSARQIKIASNQKIRAKVISIETKTKPKIFFQAFNYLMRTPKINKTIADTEKETTAITQTLKNTMPQYTDKLAAKTLCCGNVSEEKHLNETFVNRLDTVRRQERTLVYRKSCETPRTGLSQSNTS